MHLKYELEDNVPTRSSIIYAAQHVIFFITSAIVMPIMVSYALGLDQAAVAATVQRTLILCGALSLTQTRFGHRYPIMEGPAGLWIGLFLLMASMTNSADGDLSLLRTDLELGIIISGVVVFLLVITRIIDKLLSCFTHLINGTVILLMVLQISPSIVRGMAGIDNSTPHIDFISVGIFFFTMLTTLIINTYARGFIKSIATFIGVTVGWGTAWFLGLTEGFYIENSRIIAIPKPFAWGVPTFNAGTVITCIIAALVLLSIQYASINGMSDVLNKQVSKRDLMRGIGIHGLSSVLIGVFSSIPFLSFYASVGVVKMTGVAARKPFYIASVFMIIMGLIAPIGAFFSTMPSSVGYAAMIILFAIISSQAMNEFSMVDFTNRESMILGISLLIGVGIMFLPSTAFDHTNPIISGLFSNGLICGMLVAFILEHVILRKKNV